MVDDIYHQMHLMLVQRLSLRRKIDKSPLGKFRIQCICFIDLTYAAVKFKGALVVIGLLDPLSSLTYIFSDLHLLHLISPWTYSLGIILILTTKWISSAVGVY